MIRIQVRTELNLKWTKCANIPDNASAIQLVQIGKHVYSGGGMRRTTRNDIYKYSLYEDTWTALPKCLTSYHGLATLDNELIVIGGRIGTDIQNVVYTFREDRYMKLLPPMPTPRVNCSCITHRNREIIVAGGTTVATQTGERRLTDTVEIYIRDRQWYNTKRLPFALSVFTLKIINDTCYILGGTGTLSHECSQLTIYSTISSLLENAEPADSTYSTLECPVAWDQLKGKHPLQYSALVEINKIFALGGSP